MAQPEKLRVARALADLGVDVIEAGFPAASRGDWESVNAVAREVQGPIICGLARANQKDIDRKMQEFFAVKLQGAEPPSWMVRGIPFLEKGRDQVKSATTPQGNN